MMKRTIAPVCFLILAVFVVAPSAESQSDAPVTTAGGGSQKIRTSAQPLLAFSDHSVLSRSGSVLVRTNEGAYMSLHSFNLIPGNAYTVWWVFFNKPKECASRPCAVSDLENPATEASVVNATGRVVGADGTADFGAFIGVGDTTGGVFGPGLLEPMKAEIHLVVRTHGPALLNDPQRLREQISMFNGGCPPNTCEDVAVSVHQP